MSLLDEILAKVPQALLDARDLDEIARLVSVGRTRSRRVPIADIQAQLQTSGAWWAIRAAAEGAGEVPAPIRQAAIAVIDVASSRYQNVDLALPKVQEMFGALATAKLLPQDDLDALNALAIEPYPVDRLQVEAALYEPDGTPKWL